MSKLSAKYWAIVPAAGEGVRMQAGKPKQYLKLDDKTILEHTIFSLISHSKIEKVIVVLHPHDAYWPKLHLKSEKIITTIGGKERCYSVLNGLIELKEVAKDDDWVLVHDAVRPCLRSEDIDNLITQLADHAVGGLLGIRARDTLKQVNGNNMITIDRESIWHALTPQMFRFKKLLTALQNSIEKNKFATDESAAIEMNGETPVIVEGRRDNIKITHPDDLWLAKKILLQV